MVIDIHVVFTANFSKTQNLASSCLNTSSLTPSWSLLLKSVSSSCHLPDLPLSSVLHTAPSLLFTSTCLIHPVLSQFRKQFLQNTFLILSDLMTRYSSGVAIILGVFSCDGIDLSVADAQGRSFSCSCPGQF